MNQKLDIPKIVAKLGLRRFHCMNPRTAVTRPDFGKTVPVVPEEQEEENKGQYILINPRISDQVNLKFYKGFFNRGQKRKSQGT